VVIGAGTEYLYERLMRVFGSSAVIAFEDPGYKKLAQVCGRNSIGYTFIPIDDQGMSMRALAASSASVVHLSPSNHFPTGMTTTRRRREELIEWMRSDPYRFIIEDDYDSEFAETSYKLQPLFSMDTSSRVIYMNTFSKVLVPSIRISYMILPTSLLSLYRSGTSFFACTASGFEQQTLARFIDDGSLERHLNRLRSYYGKKRQKLVAAIGESRIASKLLVVGTDAGTHMLVRMATDKEDADVHRAARRINLKVQMLSDYCLRPRPSDLHTLVINFAGMEDDDIATAVQMLERLYYEVNATDI
jgi:GntR family transcriptional regulator/MocR family aminotransferase